MLRPDDVFVAAAARAPCKNVEMLVENMKIVAALVEALTKITIAHAVNISSDAVYANSSNPLTEESTMAPDTLHGVMHLARELAFRSEVRAPLAMLRPSLLYGAADPHNGYGPNRFRRLANEGKDILLFGEGEERRDHVLIDDVAELIVRVIERRSVGTLNIATGQAHSFRKVAELVVTRAPIRSPSRAPGASDPCLITDIVLSITPPLAPLSPTSNIRLWQKALRAQASKLGRGMAEFNLLRALPNTKRNVRKPEATPRMRPSWKSPAIWRDVFRRAA